MAETDRDMRVSLEWDAEVDAGYIAFAEVADGGAAHQRVVPNPVAGLGDLVLDFDRAGHLLGIEILGSGQLPPAVTEADREVGS